MTVRFALGILLSAALLAACATWPDPLDEAPNGRPIDGSIPDAPTTAISTSTPSPADPAAPPRWVPPPGTSWQWQLTTPVDTSVDVQVYDIDGFEATSALVRTLHTEGRKVICYINTGAAENFRPDHSSFPLSVQGKPDGWDGENWLDIRRLDVVRPIMAARFDMCRRKGFDAVEADLVDGYANATGFALTSQDQLTYNRLLAHLAHERGMSIALKNDLDQIPELERDFDFAINEQCAQYDECEKLTPFIQANRAVFHVEYQLDTTQFCPETTALGFSSMRKNTSLDAARWPC